MLFQQLHFYFKNVLKTEHSRRIRAIDFFAVYFTTCFPAHLDFSSRLCYYINTTDERRGNF